MIVAGLRPAERLAYWQGYQQALERAYEFPGNRRLDLMRAKREVAQAQADVNAIHDFPLPVA